MTLLYCGLSLIIGWFAHTVWSSIEEEEFVSPEKLQDLQANEWLARQRENVDAKSDSQL